VPAFSGEMAELMLKISRDDPMPLTRLRPDLPREIDQVIGWALAKDPNSRFGSVYALAHALRPFASADAQLLVDQIGRIAHSAPAEVAEVAISPTSPLAAGHAALLDDDEEGSSTVIMQSPLDAGENDMETTSFMHDSPFGGLGGGVPPARSSVPAALGSNHGLASDPFAAQAFGPGATVAQPAANAFPGAFPGPAPGSAGAAAPAKGSGLKWALVAAAVIVPVAVVLVLVLNKGGDEAKTVASTKATSSPTSGPADPVPSQPAVEKTDPVAVAAAETPPADAPAATPTSAPDAAGGAQAGTAVASNVKNPTSDPKAKEKDPKAETKPEPKAEPKPEPKAEPKPEPKPEPAASGGTTGKLIGIATGGTCQWSVDGKSQGSGSSFNATVSVGTHTVTCAPPGQAARSQRKTVSADKPALATFKLGS
ncbi:MAG: hypothetical protein FJ096_08870, partial [Deltaproteobacteria bacterium]|nr:hypothetical protein [Deltaproteobacteria bacterium]